jgi:hypothetical protein
MLKHEQGDSDRPLCHGHASRWPSGRSIENPGCRGAGEKVSTDGDRDYQALVLRDQGRPFAGVAKILALDSAGAANASFNRALRLRPKAEQARLRSREMDRLDALANRLRERPDLSTEEIIRRLRGVKHQRKTLFVA